MRTNLPLTMKPGKLLFIVISILCFLGIQVHKVLAENILSEKIIVAVANADQTDATFFSINPDGTGKKHLFNFQNHPVHKSGGLWHPRISPDYEFIYVSSDNCNLYTAAAFNLFKISSDGNSWQQLTPESFSGHWGDPCPCGIVQGFVKKNNGEPWNKSSVYLEGLVSTVTDASGFFSFLNVPQGMRWIIAYEPAGLIYNARRIDIAAGYTTQIDFIPATSVRDQYRYPVCHGERIYFLFGTNAIHWMTENSDMGATVYTSSECAGVSEIDGFDAGSVTGRLAITNCQEGCPLKQGLYITDRDGAEVKLIVDLQKDSNWCDAQEVFWAPDESRLALNACYGWYTYLLVYEAETGKPIGSYYFPDQKLTLSRVTLHGWSPDGRWLLYSYYSEEPSQGVLAKIKVNANGGIDKTSIIDIMTGKNISGATWGIISEPNTEVNDRDLPDKIVNYELGQNYPNPFNSGTEIEFSIPVKCHVRLAIYNLLGHKVATLIDAEQESGIHKTAWDGKQGDGQSLTSGIYFYMLETGEFVSEKKMTLLR